MKFSHHSDKGNGLLLLLQLRVVSSSYMPQFVSVCVHNKTLMIILVSIPELGLTTVRFLTSSERVRANRSTGNQAAETALSISKIVFFYVVLLNTTILTESNVHNRIIVLVKSDLVFSIPPFLEFIICISQLCIVYYAKRLGKNINTFRHFRSCTYLTRFYKVCVN